MRYKRFALPLLYTGAKAAFGGLSYGLLEILCRGYTHISMVIVGGGCFLILVQLSKSELPFLLQCFFGMSSITAIEFAAGYIVNIQLGLGVWDYTQEAFDLMGQVCLKFSFCWFFLCATVLPSCRFARKLSAAQSRVYDAAKTPGG